MTDTPDQPFEARPDGQLLELAGRRRVAPDELAISIERGAQALIFSDLRLAKTATDISREVCRSVSRAIEDCRGPGVVVFAGDMFDLRDGTDVESALLAHPRLSAALCRVHRGRASSAGRAAGDPRLRAGVRPARHGSGDGDRRRGRARLRARSGYRRREPARARGAGPPPRPAGGLCRSAGSERPSARATPRARDRARSRECKGFEQVAGRDRRSRRPEPSGSVRRVAVGLPPSAEAIGVARRARARGARIVLVVLRADRPPHRRERARCASSVSSAPASPWSWQWSASCSCSP